MKYKNEMQIKKAMGIENWRNLSRDKVIRFAAMMPDMDKEVMLEIIRTFPEFTKYGNELLESLRETILKTIDKNSEDYRMSLEIIKETQSICKEQLFGWKIIDEIYVRHRLDMAGAFFMPAARIRPGFFHVVFEGRWSWWRTGSRALRWRLAVILLSCRPP